MEIPFYLQPLIFITCFSVLFLWEAATPFFTWHYKRYQHAANNLTLGLMNILVVSSIYSITIIAATHFTQTHSLGLLQYLSSLLPYEFIFILGIFFIDGWMYIWHRLNHKIKFLWRFHQVHHCDANMDVSTAVRFHLGEILLSNIAISLLIILLGLSLPIIIIYGFLRVAVTFFHHANISVGSADNWLRLLIVTPDMHKVHHSIIQTETDSNYGTVFSFWDRLGGSHKKANSKNITIGLDGFSKNNELSLQQLLWLPFKRDK